MEFRQAGRSFNQMVEAVNQMISGHSDYCLISPMNCVPLTRLTYGKMRFATVNKAAALSWNVLIQKHTFRTNDWWITRTVENATNSHLSREEQPLRSLWEELLSDAQFEAEQMNKTLKFDEIPKC